MKRLVKLAAIIAALILADPELILAEELLICAEGYAVTLVIINGWGFWSGYFDWTSDVLREIIECVKIAWFVFWKNGAVETVTKGASYSLMDNLLTAISPATVGFLKWLGETDLLVFTVKWTDPSIAVVMWIEDVIIAYGLVLFSRNVIEDFTLTEALRAAVDSIRKRNTIGCAISWILTIGLTIRFSIWDGSERVAIFFHKELPGRVQELFVIMAFSVIQAIFWTKLYSWGINGLADIWKLFF